MDHVHADDGRRLTDEEEAAIEDGYDGPDPGAMTPSVAQQARDARAWPTLADVMGQPRTDPHGPPGVPGMVSDDAIPDRFQLARQVAQLRATVDQLRRRVAVLERPDDPAGAVVAEFGDKTPGL